MAVEDGHLGSRPVRREHLIENPRRATRKPAPGLDHLEQQPRTRHADHTRSDTLFGRSISNSERFGDKCTHIHLTSVAQSEISQIAERS